VRTIDINNLDGHLPEGWQDGAAAALARLHDLDGEDRAKAIAGSAEIWTSLKDRLADLSHKKCWYCESMQIRSDMAVDHFRPKGRVCECPEHEGYWWLAFDWKNLRLSCTFCNSRRKDRSTGTTGGKGDHFPLVNEGRRARTLEDDIGREEPELLDPTRHDDPGMLWFDPDGQAVPRYGQERLLARQRAERSIDLYNLNHVDICEQRLALSNKIKSLVDAGDRYLDEWLEGEPTARDAFGRAVAELRACAHARSEYSATARAALLGFRDRTWVETVFSAA
jgi:uncharacterized protein (TIGR02646 family)